MEAGKADEPNDDFAHWRRYFGGGNFLANGRSKAIAALGRQHLAGSGSAKPSGVARGGNRHRARARGRNNKTADRRQKSQGSGQRILSPGDGNIAAGWTLRIIFRSGCRTDRTSGPTVRSTCNFRSDHRSLSAEQRTNRDP